MYDAYIVRRTQIYLDPEQSSALSARARRQGTTASHLIREAVDEYLARPESEDERRLQRYRAAIGVAFGAAPDLPDGAAYVETLRAADADRMTRIHERRSR
jgi:hypothetical protein